MKRVVVTVVLILAACAVQASSPDLRFTRSYALNNIATSDVDTGDVDGDGDIDVLLSSVVMINDGKGIFTPRPHPACGNMFRLVDVDGDGHLDIAGITGPTLYILLGDGAANFTALPVQSGNHFNNFDSEMKVADINGDGLPDIVDNGGALFINRGSGHFTDEASQRGLNGSEVGIGRADVALLDANLDGRTDIFFPMFTTIPNGGRAYTLFIQKADGTFADETAARMASVTVSSLHDGLETVDLNGDGALDIVSNNGSTMKIFENDGTGNFIDRSQPYFAYPVNDYASSWALKDLNLDGHPDLVLLGANASRIYYGGPNAPIFTSRTPFTLPSGNTSFPANIHLVDLNGDGAEEILFRTGGMGSPGTIHYYISQVFPQVAAGREVLTAQMQSALEAVYTLPDGVVDPTYTWTLYRSGETVPAYVLSGVLAPLDGSSTTSPAGAKVEPGVYRADLAVKDSCGRTIATGTLGFAVTVDYYDAYVQCGDDRATLQNELATSRADLAASQAALAMIQLDLAACDTERASLAAQIAACGSEKETLLQDAALTQAGLQEIRRLAALPAGQRRSTFQPQGSQAQIISQIITLLLPGNH